MWSPNQLQSLSNVRDIRRNGKEQESIRCQKNVLKFWSFWCSAETPDVMKFRQNAVPTYRNKRTRIRLASEGHLDYFLYDDDGDNHYNEYVISSGRNRAATIDGNGKWTIRVSNCTRLFCFGFFLDGSHWTLKSRQWDLIPNKLCNELSFSFGRPPAMISRVIFLQNRGNNPSSEKLFWGPIETVKLSGLLRCCDFKRDQRLWWWTLFAARIDNTSYVLNDSSRSCCLLHRQNEYTRCRKRTVPNESGRFQHKVAGKTETVEFLAYSAKFSKEKERRTSFAHPVDCITPLDYKDRICSAYQATDDKYTERNKRKACRGVFRCFARSI